MVFMKAKMLVKLFVEIEAIVGFIVKKALTKKGFLVCVIRLKKFPLIKSRKAPSKPYTRDI